MDREIERILRFLRYRYLNYIFAEDSEDAERMGLDLILQDAVVGIGDSTTVRQIGVKERLKRRGTKMLDDFDHKTVYNPEDWEKLVVESMICDFS